MIVVRYKTPTWIDDSTVQLKVHPPVPDFYRGYFLRRERLDGSMEQRIIISSTVDGAFRVNVPFTSSLQPGEAIDLCAPTAPGVEDSLEFVE